MFRPPRGFFGVGGSSFSKTPKIDTPVGRRSFSRTPKIDTPKAIGIKNKPGKTLKIDTSEAIDTKSKSGENPTRVNNKRDRLNKEKQQKLQKLLELPREPNAKEIQQRLNTKTPAARSALVEQLMDGELQGLTGVGAIAAIKELRRWGKSYDMRLKAILKPVNAALNSAGLGGPLTSIDVLNYLAKPKIARNEAAEQQQAITKIANPFARLANRGALSWEQQQAIGKIADHRLAKKLPPLDLTPKVGGKTGTVAYINEGGKEFFGFNTSLERDLLKADTLALRKGVLSEIQTKLEKLQGAKIDKAAQFLTHAEAQAVINAKQALGKLPEKMTVYVDRPTCNMCSGSANNGLPLLAELFGVKELTIIDSLGTKLLVRPGQKTIRIK